MLSPRGAAVGSWVADSRRAELWIRAVMAPLKVLIVRGRPHVRKEQCGYAAHQPRFFWIAVHEARCSSGRGPGSWSDPLSSC